LNNIKLDPRERERMEVVWAGFDLAQDKDQWKAHLNTVINIRVALNVGKFFSSCTTGGFLMKGSALWS
jgi:hypothetical protein